jgi:Leucine-rich repeat (LRR) protein
LELSNNNLENIPSEGLRHMLNLAELNLAKNNIKIIFGDSLSNMKLSFLDLSGNKIQTIHQKAFHQVKSIKQLNIQDNELSEVPSALFQSFEKLEILDIGQNSLSCNR